jgi:hypothetical protein
MPRRDQLIEAWQEIIAQHDADTQRGTSFLTTRQGAHRRRTCLRVHAAGVGDDAHAAAGDRGQHALDGTEEIPGVSE